MGNGTSSNGAPPRRRRSQMKRLVVSLNTGTALDDVELKSRFEALLAEHKGKLTRAAVLADLLEAKVNSAVERRFFEAVSGVSNTNLVDFPAFSRAVVAIERISPKESRRIVFAMFDPLGSGRLFKPEFRKALVDLSSNASTEENKPLVQVMTDSAFAEFCADEKLGMSFEEWANFAAADPDTCALLAALRARRKREGKQDEQ